MSSARRNAASIAACIRITRHSPPSTSSPRKHGGSDHESNLCLACIDCNLRKGPNLAGIVPLTGAVTALFHPRQQRWEDHFAWQGIHITGKTATGRTTVQVLEMNSDDQLNLRAAG